jgi:hypothetical protein
MTTDASTEAANSADIVARGAKGYRIKHGIVALGLVLYGFWCISDGFYNWPQMNAENQAKHMDAAHSDLDIKLNQGLGIGLPVLGLIMAARAAYHSRGEYRLAGDSLSAPGHSNISLSAIESIDKTQWDRKGIAKLAYVLPAGKTGSIVLDDYVYERAPIDAIVKRIEESMQPTGPAQQQKDPG